MAKTNPITFIREVRAEMKKVTWPTRQETIASTVAVFIMVVLAAVFLFLSDQVVAFVISLILGLG
jgi:preprotein translocase subunit SecE